MRSVVAFAALAVAVAPADADPYRLRSNAFALSQADTPAGLLTLSANGDPTPWMSAEAVVWMGAGDDSEADAMVVYVKIRDPQDRGELQLGRFIAVPGALRPLHLDGARGLARLPYDLRLEVFGGIPVMPELGASAYDWAAGSRVSRALGEWGSVGVAYLQRRTEGRLDDEEVGVDVGFAPARWLDLGARLAYDLELTGVSDAHLSVAARRGAWRWELFGTHRSPSRILPATSLFTVLGDVPAQLLGGAARWRAAPRLDVHATAALRLLDDEAGAELKGRAVLRLDDRGARAVSFELRRDSAPDAGWTGARATARIPIDDRFTAMTELELVFPDDSDVMSDVDRGSVWPWALVGVTWKIAPSWLAAAAAEASSSAEYRYRFDGLVRVSHLWEAP